MDLKTILQKLVENDEPILLRDNEKKDWEAGALLSQLSERTLKTPAHLQHGMYIAEINNAGYLGRIIFRVRQKG